MTGRTAAPPISQGLTPGSQPAPPDLDLFSASASPAHLIPTSAQETLRVSSPSDRAWFREVVERYEGPLTIYAARFAGDVDRGRDIVQDAFLRLWEADREAVEGHVGPWLYRVCRNRAIDVRRKEGRMTHLEPEAVAQSVGSDHQSPSLDGSATPDEAPPGDAVTTAIGKLPPRQQEAVRLKFQGGLSYREIADVMETSVNNVGVLLHHAIKGLRASLAADLPTAKGTGQSS